MNLDSDVQGATLIFLGVDIIISVFLLGLTVRIRRLRPKMARFLTAIFIIFLAESLFVSLQFLGLTFLNIYSQLSTSLQIMTVMLIFYVGIVKVKSK